MADHPPISPNGITPADEFVVSVEVGREWLRTGAYLEQLSPLNPFQAAAPAGTDTVDVAKARAVDAYVHAGC